MTFCPNHHPGQFLGWCADDDGMPHLGIRCLVCGLWLRWLPPDLKDAPEIPHPLIPFRETK